VPGTEYFHLATPFDEGNCSGCELLESLSIALEKCQPEERRLQGEFPDELVVGFYGEYGWERLSSYLVVKRCSGYADISRVLIKKTSSRRDYNARMVAEVTVWETQRLAAGQESPLFQI
jgi:hypothetical protein